MNYRYANHDEVAELLKNGKPGKDYAVVDVRDDDYRGGNIPGAIRAPSEDRTEQSVNDLVRQLKGVPKVVFHCSLSQVRGPKAARIYADALAASQPPVPALDSSAVRSSDTITQDAANLARNFSPNPYLSAGQTGRQEVLVLRDGFSNWQGLYRNDPLLVANFDSRIWQDYSP
ncbi:M-phase inducer phosphatase, protein tyrosine phosphatase [Rhodotorula toruloides]|uniref:M-phase inducer phosphatase, protein tyrosine phosphatase n=1 Tax=Rhodotorula toruloides TaxID=5286 RepID=A0A511KLT7_RHOTO|nr:M-phase inducer phosphatase, protein tyrosine phosphatase [Rhodotorula toruloides]